MPRCKKHRCCRRFENEIVYKPVAVPFGELDVVLIGLDEFEAMRLCDLEGMDQSEAGIEMNVSRGTIQRLLASGRRKLVEGMLNGAAIRINQLTRSEEK